MSNEHKAGIISEEINKNKLIQEFVAKLQMGYVSPCGWH